MDFLKNIFTFSIDSPLLFTRIYFWIFLLVVLAGYSIIYKQKAIRNIYLFIVSLFFYYQSSGIFFLLLIFSTLADYLIGFKIFHAKKVLIRKLYFTLSILINLGMLFYFKYAYFITGSINSLFGTSFQVTDYFAVFINNLASSSFDTAKILLPVGISFFTFQTISYAADIYKRKIEPVKNIFDFGFYVSFFPQLVAGPIVRASEFVPQLYREYSLSKQEFGHALFLILSGLIKKLVIGDYLAVNFIDRVFTNPMMYSGFENLLALYGYSLQVYCDFSGYTDIAIGVALLMGFRLPKNFNSPYKAKNLSDFWRRWHISLSSWLKDYLYIPTGGNRSSSFFSKLFVLAAIYTGVLYKNWDFVQVVLLLISSLFWLLSEYYSKKNVFRVSGIAILLLHIFYVGGTSWLATTVLSLVTMFWILDWIFPSLKISVSTDINIMITMLLGGLWHGASANFMIWGGINGVGLLIYKLWTKIFPGNNNQRWYQNFWKIMLTFNFITFTRIFFRAEDFKTANDVMKKITMDWNFSLIPGMVDSYKIILGIMIFGFIVHWLPASFKEKYRGWFIKSPIWTKAIIVIFAIFVIYQTITAELQPFIYFQF